MNNIENLNGEMLGRACAFTGKNDIRPNLNGLFIEKREEGGVNIVATNGHILCVYQDPEAIPCDSFENIVLNIYQPNSKRLLPVFTQLKKTNSERVDLFDSVERDELGDITDRQLLLIRITEEEPFAEPVSAIEGLFPKWKKVIKSGLKMNKPISFSPQYLAKLKDFVLKDEDPKFPEMTLVAGKTGSPCIFQSAHGLVLIMPMSNRGFELNELLQKKKTKLKEVGS